MLRLGRMLGWVVELLWIGVSCLAYHTHKYQILLYKDMKRQVTLLEDPSRFLVTNLAHLLPLPLRHLPVHLDHNQDVE